MLTTKWNWVDALDYRYIEGWFEGFERDYKKITEKLRQEAIKKGIQPDKEKSEEEVLEITVQRAIEQGFPIDTISAISGLSEDAVKGIQIKNQICPRICKELIRNALAQENSLEAISALTGLSEDAVRNIQAKFQ
jgi:hypothetical protein